MKELTLPGTLRRFAPAGRLIACMALALLLTACRLGGYAPLSLALTALAGPGLPGLAGLAGAGLGALVFLDFQSGLQPHKADCGPAQQGGDPRRDARAARWNRAVRAGIALGDADGLVHELL